MKACSPALTDELGPRMLSQVKVRDVHDGTRSVGAVTAEERHATVGGEELSRRLGIGLDTANQMLKVTTQVGVRQAMHPLSRRYKTDLIHGTSARRLGGTWYSDTMFAPKKSLSSKTCAQVFTNTSLITVHPMEHKDEAGIALTQFVDDVGIPDTLIFDGAGEQVGVDTDFQKTIRYYRVHQRQTEPYSPWQNRAEDAIKKLKTRWKRIKRITKCSDRLWDYALTYEAKMMSLIPTGRDARTPHEEVTGDTPDISEYLDFDFYDPVWYIHQAGNPDDPRLGRWLGVSHRVGAAMCYWVLTATGKVEARSTVQHVTKQDLENEAIRDKLKELDIKIASALGEESHVQDRGEAPFYQQDQPGDDDGDIELVEEHAMEADDYDPDAFDAYLGARLLLPRDGERVPARVTKRMKGNDGRPIGTAHQQPLMDTRQYEVEFDDGSTEEYYANVIAENMFAQCDDEGRQCLLLSEITDFKKDERAIPKEDGMITMPNGRQHPKRTTAGWKLQVEWKDGTQDWIPLKDLKDSNPVETAEFAVANRIHEEPAFKWWVPKVLKRRNRILAKVKTRYWRTSHKFGIELPHSVEEAYAIDARTGTLHWTNAIKKEMKKILELRAFRTWEGGTPEQLRKQQVHLPGYSEIGCHMIFDIKMDGKFTRKARFVANGNETESLPAWDTYASVVSRETVRLAFLYAALNDLDILTCDVSNAYLNAKAKEKRWMEAGAEFGSDKGKVMILEKAVYGLKSAASAWRQTLAKTLDDLGYKPSRADENLYQREATGKNGDKYYEWLLVYVDDLMCVSEKPQDTMTGIAKVYELRDSVKPPDRYLGANVGKWQLHDGREVWCTSGKDYVKNSVKQVKEILEKRGLEMPTGRTTKRPMMQDYRPEIDVSPELGPKDTQVYQQLIGMLRWACELGRVDILYEVSLLSSHLALPREGHLEAAFGVFAYLNKHEDSVMVYDPKPVRVDPEAFITTDWSDSVYGDVKEELPSKALEPRGNSVRMTCLVDASHAGDLSTRRSHTGYIIYLNNAPIAFYSKKQNTVESSTFGSEIVALRTAMEAVRSLRIKLRLLGIPLEGPTDVLCDNDAVVKSTSRAESRLNKKHQAICWHAIRESCAAGWMRIGKEDGETNTADLFTKSLNPEKRRQLLLQIFIKGGRVVNDADEED